MAWEENSRISLHMQIIVILSRTGVMSWRYMLLLLPDNRAFFKTWLNSLSVKRTSICLSFGGLFREVFSVLMILSSVIVNAFLKVEYLI